METQAHGGEGLGNEHPHHEHLVHVTVDGNRKEVPGGEYRVSTFKALVSVPADYELNRVVGGVFHPFADDAEIEIKAGDVFVGQMRRGGSS